MFRTYMRFAVRLFSFVVCLLFQFQLLCFANSKVEILETVTQFSFGSCNKETLPQPLWPALTDLKPQFFIWMGDAIYGDTKDPQLLKEKFQIQLQQPDYAQFIQKTPIIGTWDDHDYGKNNAGRKWKFKDVAQQYFLDFIGEPPVSSRRQQKGIYTSYLMGPPGQQIKVILLDTRYHKSDANDIPDDILGEQQWQWLENELKTSPAQANFLVSSFSVLSPSLAGGEQWIDFSNSWERFNAILKRTHPKGFAILTGDRHFGGMLNRKLEDGYTYYELMSSGMTHVAKSVVRSVLQQIYGRENTLFERNFGRIKIDWGRSGRIKQMEFSLHSDSTMSQPAWSRVFAINNDKWVLQQ